MNNKTKTDSQTENELTATKREARDKLGVWDSQTQTATWKISDKEPLYNTGDHIQHLIINYKGKNLKEYKYIHAHV